jgi:hypothetical protein
MSQAKSSDWAQKWGEIVSKAWSDEGFKKRLISEPAAILKENALEIPPGVQVKVVENTDKVLHLVLPPKASSHELSEADLAALAGGMDARKITASDRAK